MIQDMIVPFVQSNFQVDFTPWIVKMFADCLVIWSEEEPLMGLERNSPRFLVPAVLTWPHATSCPAFACSIRKLLVLYDGIVHEVIRETDPFQERIRRFAPHSRLHTLQDDSRKPETALTHEELSFRTKLRVRYESARSALAKLTTSLKTSSAESPGPISFGITAIPKNCSKPSPTRAHLHSR